MMTNTPHIGTQLRHIRRSHKLTQIQLSAKSGIDRITILNIERGYTDPHYQTIAQLLTAMDYQIKLLPKPRA